MHHFQHELAAIARGQMKILVVLAGQRFRGRLDRVKFARELRRLLFCGAASHRRIKKHAGSVSASVCGSPRGVRLQKEIEDEQRRTEEHEETGNLDANMRTPSQ